ncbi:MAG: ferrochelatase [Verrucomicrobia bacterium]|nr:ferrochelatase [Verrucomicrobiota bacterium]
MSKKAVLLVNLGSPDSPSVPDVRRYLREFLMDGRVLDLPWPIRFCLVNFIIAPFRAGQSAHAYRSIWLPEGSPLVVTGRRVQAELQRRLSLPVELAMCYQQPSIPNAVDWLRDQGVEQVLLIPLFPHYAMSSWEAAVEQVKQVMARQAAGLSLLVVPPYYDDPGYLRALAGSAAPYLAGDYDHLLLSFHGLPERHLRKTDPTGHHCLTVVNCCQVDSPAHRTCYRAQCYKTAAAFVKMAGAKNFSVAFQSRLGRDAWLRPYTDEELKRLAASGVKRLLVICPAFVADCLETLEEINLRGRTTFLEAGGREFVMIPCLNEHPLWMEALEGMVRKSWPGSAVSQNKG